MVTAQEKGGASQGLGLRPPRTEALTLLGSPSGLRWAPTSQVHWEAQGTAGRGLCPTGLRGRRGRGGQVDAPRGRGKRVTGEGLGPLTCVSLPGNRTYKQLWEKAAQLAGGSPSQRSEEALEGLRGLGGFPTEQRPGLGDKLGDAQAWGTQPQTSLPAGLLLRAGAGRAGRRERVKWMLRFLWLLV